MKVFPTPYKKDFNHCHTRAFAVEQEPLTAFDAGVCTVAAYLAATINQ